MGPPGRGKAHDILRFPVPAGRGRPHPGARRLPAGQRGHQRRPGRAGRHQRRVDPQPGRHRQPPDRRPERDRGRHGRRGRRQGAGRQRPVPRRHRPGHRGHLHAPRRRSRTWPPWSRTGSASPRPAPTTSTPPAPASATRWPSPSDAIRAGSARHVLVIGVEKLSDWVDSDRPLDRIIFADGAGAAVVGPVPTASRPASARSPGAAPGDMAREDHHRRPQLVPAPGGPGGVPVGDHDAAPGRRAGLRAGRASTPSDLDAFVPHQANLRIVEAIATQARRAQRRAWPTTSCTRATPPRPRSRWRCRGWSSAARCDSGDACAAARLRRGPLLRGAGGRGALAAPSPGDRAGDAWARLGRLEPQTSTNTGDTEHMA